MTIANDDVIQAVVDFVTPEGFHMQNKFTWIADFVAGVSEATVLAGIVDWVGTFYNRLAGDMHENIADPDVAVDIIAWLTDHWEVSARVGEGIAGTTPTNQFERLPFPNTAYIVGRTARPRSRGRKFMPVYCEDRQDAGTLITASQNALGNALIDYLDNITVSTNNDLIPGVASTVVGTFLPFVSGFTSDLLGTQRRRRQGYGI